MPERARLIEEATRFFQVEPDSDAYKLAAVRDGVLAFFMATEAAGELDEPRA